MQWCENDFVVFVVSLRQERRRYFDCSCGEESELWALSGSCDSAGGTRPPRESVSWVCCALFVTPCLQDVATNSTFGRPASRCVNSSSEPPPHPFLPPPLFQVEGRAEFEFEKPYFSSSIVGHPVQPRRDGTGFWTDFVFLFWISFFQNATNMFRERMRA